MSSTMEETPVDESCDHNGLLSGGTCSGESLYELMPRIPIYDSNGEDSITDTKQVALDTNQESLIIFNESECRAQRSNQYMECVKYSGYERESDYSSDEDANGKLCHTFGCSKENYLCKLCCSSYLGYDSNAHCTKHVHPLFKYALSYEPSTPLPLLQLYSQRCEENYNLDIDIVLIYVNSVIDQLKRISDGEYLTKEVKERWMAVNCEFMPKCVSNTDTEVTSIHEIFRSKKDFIVISKDNAIKTETNNKCMFECEEIIKEPSQMLTDSEESELTVMKEEIIKEPSRMLSDSEESELTVMKEEIIKEPSRMLTDSEESELTVMKAEIIKEPSRMLSDSEESELTVMKEEIIKEPSRMLTDSEKSELTVMKAEIIKEPSQLLTDSEESELTVMKEEIIKEPSRMLTDSEESELTVMRVEVIKDASRMLTNSEESELTVMKEEIIKEPSRMLTDSEESELTVMRVEIIKDASRMLTNSEESELTVMKEEIIKEPSRVLTDSEESEMTIMGIERPDKVHPTESAGIQQNLQITLKMEPSLLEYFFQSIDNFKKLEGRKICINVDKTTESMLPVPPNAGSFLKVPKYLKCIEQYPRPSISKIVDITEVGSDTNINVEQLKNDGVISENNLSQNSSKTTVTLADVLAQLPKNQVNSKHSPFNPTSVDELKVSIQNLDIQPCLMEETNEEIQETVTKSKSNIFKSPYENQSLTLEEKRRMRLLEIRDNREKKGIKIIHEQEVGKFRRNVKSCVSASKSVTKLSITNKSFYNSIFGQHNNIINTRNLKMKTNYKNYKKDKCLKDTLRQKSKERVLTPTTTSINIPSEVKCALRDVVESKGRLEKSNTQIPKAADSARSSLSSNSIDTKNIKVNLLSENESADKYFNNGEISESIILHNTKSMHYLLKNNDGAPRSKPKSNISYTKISMEECKMLDPIDEDDRLSEKKYPSRIEVECRESIGKIYDLMRKLGTTDKVALKNTKTKFTASPVKQQVRKEYELPTWDSESGGSCKQYSNTSFKSSSAEKLNKIRLRKLLQSNCIKEPKVIIKSKDSTNNKKLNAERANEKDYKKINLSTLNKPMQPYPLPAITKVLNEISNLQRAKRKIKQEKQQIKYTNLPNRDYSKKSLNLEQHYLDRNEKVVNRTQKNRDTRPKMFYKFPDTVIEKNRTLRRSSEMTDEEREARGEAVRGPSTSRLDALAQPRQSYVKAHSEQITRKYGRSLMTERLQRFVHAQQSHPPVTYQQNVKLKSGFANENTLNVTRNSDAEKLKLQSSSTFVEPKTISSTSREGLPFNRNPGAIASPRGNTTSTNSNASWVLAPKPNQEVKAWIPLVPKASEHYELQKDDALETLIQKLEKSQQNARQLKVTRENHRKHCAAKRNMESEEVEPVLPLCTLAEVGVAKVKYGKVIIETEDLVDSDIHSFSDSLLKNFHFENSPSKNDNKMNDVTILERVNTDAFVENSNFDGMKHTVIISNLPLTKVSLENISVFQAGDASSIALPCKSTSTRNFSKNCFTVESYTNMHDLQGLICLSKGLSVWNVEPIPRQISTVYYSFPEICAPKVTSKSKTCYTASLIDFEIMHRSTEYMVSSTIHQSRIGNTQHSDRSKQEKTDNTEDGPVVASSVTSTGVEGQLESTSSIDVLFKLLNEIHSITMGTMQVASVYGFQMVENVKPLHYATTYSTMSTTEEAFVSYALYKDMQDVEYKLKKIEGFQALYEDSLIEIDLNTNRSKDRCLKPSLHTLLSPKRCKGTSTTGLNINISPSDDTIFGDATWEPYEPDVKCRSDKVKQNTLKANNESSGKVTNKRLKRDLLICMYGILILAGFAVMSVPGIFNT